jgi:glycogen operon protein
MPTDTLPGQSHPLGASIQPEGVNFAVYSKSASGVELLFFDDVDDERPSRVFELDPDVNRTFQYWHILVPGVEPGQIYGFRVRGPWAPERRMRFDGQKLLLDPYGLAVAVGERYQRRAAAQPGPNIGRAMKSVVFDPCVYDWEGDRPLQRPYSDTVIYEMHVAGFTRHPNSGLPPERRGTYGGVIDKLPYLQSLGITAIELLPVYQFDEQDCPEGLSNYWGYAPVSFFAPHLGYSMSGDPLRAIDEFRDLVKACHRAGIEVILDVVYNHTAEGDERGPTFCYRGFEDDAYYILEQSAASYSNYSGTGNTVNANHSVVRRMIVDSLTYWVTHMHVDGFRFDLASILSRDEQGRPLENPPVLWAIESDPVLAGTKIIAEAWDAAGLYQVGTFLGDRWTEWNGRFRDDIRSFVKGDEGAPRSAAARLLGSPDMYLHQEREPGQSINFVTCHDGFTLNDLVSYNQKHNEANLEGNRDGTNNNISWNCGVEGPTEDLDIEALRNRQVKNFLALLLLSVGTPMLLMGDELRRTQRGNNNVYCQDSELSWMDWSLLEKHGDIRRWVQGLIRGRRGMDIALTMDRMSLSTFLTQAGIRWHGIRLDQPDWGDASRLMSASFTNLSRTLELHLIANAYHEPLTCELPPPVAGAVHHWHRLLDTTLPSPEDMHRVDDAPRLANMHYTAGPFSVVLLFRPYAAPATPVS